MMLHKRRFNIKLRTPQLHSGQYIALTITFICQYPLLCVIRLGEACIALTSAGLYPITGFSTMSFKHNLHDSCKSQYRICGLVSQITRTLQTYSLVIIQVLYLIVRKVAVALLLHLINFHQLI